MKNDYSLARALECARSGKLSGIEAEQHREIEILTGQKALGDNSILVPLSAVRAANVTTATDGGFLVGASVPTVTEAFRPASVAIRAGAVVIESAMNVTIPGIASGMTAHWLAETETCPEGTVAFNSPALTPRRCAGWLKFSNQLLTQSGGLADMVARRELRASIGSAIDLAAFSGVGGVEPLGLLNNPNVAQPVTFGGAAALADFTLAEQTIADANAEDGTEVFVTSPAARAKLRATNRDGAAGVAPIWTDDNRILGKPAFASRNVADNRLVYGRFSDMCIALFGALFVTVDRITQAKTQQTQFIVNAFADVAPMRAASFLTSTDSAAQ